MARLFRLRRSRSQQDLGAWRQSGDARAWVRERRVDARGWCDDGHIVFDTWNGGLRVVDGEGGEPRVLTAPTDEWHLDPQPLPGRCHVLLYTYRTEGHSIEAISADGGGRTLILDNASHGRFRLPYAELAPEPRFEPQAASLLEVGLNPLLGSVLEAAAAPSPVPFGAGAPDPHLLPERLLNRLLSKLAPGEPGHSSRYHFAPGAEPLRRQIARRLIEIGCPAAPGDIVITTGAMEAVNLSLRAVASPGDAIAFERPTYYGLLQPCLCRPLRRWTSMTELVFTGYGAGGTSSEPYPRLRRAWLSPLLPNAECSGIVPVPTLGGVFR